MRSFDTLAEALEHVKIVDIPVQPATNRLDYGASLRKYSHHFEDGTFTNIYEVSYPDDAVSTNIYLHNTLTDMYSFAKDKKFAAVANAGFFFVANVCKSIPRQPSFNLAMAHGEVRSLPLADQETLICRMNGTEISHIKACGMLSLNGADLSWAGSLSPNTADTRVFGAANAVIRTQKQTKLGPQRVAEESSYYTPPTEDEEIDIGFIHMHSNVFKGVSRSKRGALSIHDHDLVLRCHEKNVSLKANDKLLVHTIGSLSVGNLLRGAVSVGPSFDTGCFETHPINNDRSLGDKSPVLDQRFARMVFYKTHDGYNHLRLFDARPGSPTFTGVTPREAVSLIQSEKDVIAGCFLDSGNSAKLCVNEDNVVASYGNRHYVQLPQRPGEPYLWDPNMGRPLSSMITVGW